MWHPLRLAEDYAMADILTGGRTVFGVGSGYHTREVETLGAPLLDQPANRDLFEEQVDIIFKAFNQESFSHKGDVYTIPPEVPYRGYELSEITLVPRPSHLPVECWQPIQSATQRGLDFMAKHGIGGIIGGGSSEGGAMEKAVEGFRDAYFRHGTELALGEKLSIGFHYHIAENQEKAIEQVGKYYEENLKMFGPLRLVRSLSDAQIEIMGDPQLAPFADLPRVEDSVRAGGVLAGTPEMITCQLKELEKKYQGLERISVSHPVGTPQTVIIEQLQQFSEEVMPHFKVTSVPADPTVT
jgi:alkanesulfonate monooxygenase SsuD/methylene tetrahydromethanopterin reductase-like flavin-dependent oxidoreductase (luciferase family)